jgi:hypothetical protein
MFPPENKRVINTRVVGNVDYLYRKCIRLKGFKDRYKITKR